MLRTDWQDNSAAYLLILVGRDRYEFCLLEHVCPERAVRQLQNVVSSHQMEPWLIFVHRVQDSLKHAVNTHYSWTAHRIDFHVPVVAEIFEK
jgi:hypothetical protein